MTHLKCHFDFQTIYFLSFDVRDDVLRVVLDAFDIRIRADRHEPDFKAKMLEINLIICRSNFNFMFNDTFKST